MKLSTRSIMRDFPMAKAAARKGQAVEIVDGKTGKSFIAKAKPVATFGQLAARAKGSYEGARNLSRREDFSA
jgi:RecB family exonuclease